MMTSDTPLFSIITVCFNAENTIERTLQSVASQTFRSFEYLIIDGASKDHTLELVRKYTQVVTHVVSEPDNGLYDAMNKGIRQAKGDYLIFLNAGDKLHSASTLEDVAKVVRKSKIQPGVLYGNTDIVDGAGRFLRKRRLTPPRRLTWKSFQSGMRVCHQSFYALREITPLYNTAYRFSADFDWCIRVMKKATERGLSLVKTECILTDYLDEGLTTRNHKASLLERFRIMSHYYGFVPTIVRHIGFVLRAVWKR